MTGQAHCWFHNPAVSEAERQAAAQKGGAVAAQHAALTKQVAGMAAEMEVDLSTPLAVRRLLEALARAVLVGGVHPQRSNALVAICNAANKANEVAIELALMEELEREKARS